MAEVWGELVHPLFGRGNWMDPDHERGLMVSSELTESFSLYNFELKITGAWESITN